MTVPEGRFIWISEKEFQDWSYAVDVEGIAGGYVEKACDPLLQRYREAPEPKHAVEQALSQWTSVARLSALRALGLPRDAEPAVDVEGVSR